MNLPETSIIQIDAAPCARPPVACSIDQIHQALSIAVRDERRVEATISEVRERGGTLWLGLTQVLADTRIARSLSGRVHRAAREALDDAAGSRFGKEHIGCTIVADVRLGLAQDGRVKATVIDVLQVRASSLQQAARTALQSLQADGLLTLQRRLPPPAVVNTIVAICPAASAGQADVAYSLGRLFGPWSVDIRWLPSTFEGPGTEASIRAALDAAAYMASRNEIAAVLIVRGGGSPGSLAYLDSEPLARAVAAMRVPVITGLAHADNRTLLDEVAHYSAATPTDAAQWVIRARAAVERERPARAGAPASAAETVPVAPVEPPASSVSLQRTQLGDALPTALPLPSEVAVIARAITTAAESPVPRPAYAGGRECLRHRVYDPATGGDVGTVVEARRAAGMTIAFPDGEIAVWPAMAAM